MARLFGTDGVRGLANEEVTADLALRLGRAAAAVLGEVASSTTRPLAVVGRDPRASGEMLEAAIVAGLSSAGVDVLTVGVVPTPALAYLTDDYDAQLGVMISASHNAMPDNGIKFFAAGGHKLDDDQEDRIEALLDAPATGPVGAAIGRVRQAPDALARYESHLATIVSRRLDGITVVVDCAHGAASTAAPDAYRAAGATVIAINADPDGLNINDGCGSTHLDVVQKAVVEHGADLGLAHDGDADRCLAVDASGAVVDGDAIMAILAIAMHQRGELPDDTLVATVMSNLGLHIAMRDAGITVRTTAVGDRYVLEELRAGNYGLGGEQSGHIVLPAFGTTGDGVLTGLQIMARMAETGRTLEDLASVMRTLPQVLINVPVQDKSAATSAPLVQDAVTRAEDELGREGRVLLRPSGTEQLVRVMVEADTADTARRLADHIADVVGAVG
ncbi:phosphoglucosamine mutase [Rhodococcus sp. BP-149]|uniref:phosphoglucosamine mutase n=1 Tax=unclassified Rhodococcus (in: high G+C Gram-positive bacteria) TaxID=192944 RepID=UPI001C9B995F|nr:MULTISPECIES: phosphoglucosamine mutase [unclassified Rhodococcus (in: high G+C Gram-positive bacteria)]MBY6684052.1 phosphoglucosamine mutase [Rhodococcus sp. BP-288]MBY6693287.1 phosphoglucosamine mutase [Rhodococcus sp. BP-188]MBY6697484.1 phosphoglucosamine mutase [Rhodococcus sp. BP-285]MBY6702161.1 phosphoglucosamine mutase [Rhodococcus sp. BP-283]MBY6709906.1 phosphoglucosamine mutase [Rhodococcus sp. BP-160]